MEKVITKQKLHQKNSDRDFWLSKSAEERLSAIELYRKQYYGEDYESLNRLQRVFKIIKRT